MCNGQHPSLRLGEGDDKVETGGAGEGHRPLSSGAGKVWKLSGGTTLNLFVEPQWTASEVRRAALRLGVAVGHRAAELNASGLLRRAHMKRTTLMLLILVFALSFTSAPFA